MAPTTTVYKSINQHLPRIKFIQKTSGLSKSKLQLLGWLNHYLFSYCPVVVYDSLLFQTIHLFKLTLSNKLQNYLSVFCKKVKMDSSKRTRVVLLQIGVKAAPVLLINKLVFVLVIHKSKFCR
jgi:hypothetical protein